ncbi:MAG: enoyl-CoA hydratase/isomerase family protein, partial [Gammaproteobacteria bacterium]|nr:enoyl-CoA hydratase/isomerase family protein [Gammaproteobacteria bacterium]
MTDYQFINYRVTNGVATIALNSPDTLNAFHQKMRLELMQAVDFVETDASARVVILTGEGRAFSAGADLSEGAAGYTSFVDQCAAEYTPWLMSIHNSSKLYIAAVNGACAGVGVAAAMNCDMMIMADDAYLYQAFAAIGLMPDGGANWLLVNRLGYPRALQLAVEAGRLKPKQCLEFGIANKVVPANELISSAQQWGEKLAAGSPLAQASTKNLMRRVSAMTYQ